MISILQDVRYSLRSLQKQRTLTLIAVGCLALGIGANTAIFSVVRTVLLGALPYHEPDRLVRVFETAAVQGKRGVTGSVSYPTFTDWRERTKDFAGLAAYDANDKNLVAQLEPERLHIMEVSANMFSLLGATPLMGRTFRAGEDQPAAAPAVVLSERFWRRRFGGRKEVLDSVIKLDSTGYTIVGVMPAVFDLPIAATHVDAWVPAVAALNGDSKSRGSHYLNVIARLRPAVTQRDATKELEAIIAQIALKEPTEMEGRGALLRPMTETVTSSVRPALLLLMGAVGLVLLIACANVANLLLARASGRRREIAIRTALGADPRRIIRQFLTESVILALCGGTLGVAVAYGSLKMILALAATALPRADAIGLDPQVLAFTALVSVITGLVFGLAPALQASRTDLRSDLSDSGGKTSMSGSRHRVLKTLVIAEIALSTVLLAGAGLLIRSFSVLSHTESGMQASHVLTFHTRVSRAGATGPDSTPYIRFYGPLLERLRAIPGVRTVGMTSKIPIQSTGMNGDMIIVGRPVEDDVSKRPYGEFRVVSSDYFKTLGIPVTKGREFDDHDTPGALPVMMINEEFARRYFPKENPVGRQMRAWSNTAYTIVGVAANVKQVGLDQDPRSEVYVNAAFNPQRLGDMSFVLSTTGNPADITSAARAAVHNVSPGQPVYAVETLEQIVSDSLQGRQLTLVLLSVLAGLALTLAAAGIYGVMAYTVSQRTRELGIRMALGANKNNVMTLVLKDAAGLAAIGVGEGLFAAIVLAVLMRPLVFGVSIYDPVTLLLSCLILPAVAIGASLVPALRAARSDPLIAIRAE